MQERFVFNLYMYKPKHLAFSNTKVGPKKNRFRQQTDFTIINIYNKKKCKFVNRLKLLRRKYKKDINGL